MNGSPPDSSTETPSPVLSFAEALQPPCESCDAYCCCYLPLQVVPARNLMEIDFLRYALNFARVEAGFTIGGQWSLYYVMPCRLFDRNSRTCTVHGSDLQPKTCSAYNEHDCWYQRATRDDAAGFLRFDRTRFARLLAALTFDRDRNLAAAPDWSQMTELCRTTPLAYTWQDVLAGKDILVPPPLLRVDEPAGSERTMAEFLVDPCSSCTAPCCRYLMFPLPKPQTFMQLDYVQFCLGFPGIEVAVSAVTWSLLLRADCRFFDVEQRRCTVFGQPERPLRCQHLNQWQCGQYRQLVQASAPLQLLDHAAFAEAMAQVRFDDQGQIVSWTG